ncbi:tail assembly protein [Moellerella wisconsensis]|uniref:tail assembly protein n=1 Tax=Moellerella wisconsensis TaxID=158849 RepID=UPI0025B1AD15|nr:tail assembly protein [Moellerella wisconsensis]WJW81020.1 tail assembly protein [Moellerella wisconsensis]
MAKNDAFNLALPPLATIRFYGDLQRFGHRFDLNIRTAAEGLHALFLQIPHLKQKFREGWYQIRISGSDVNPNELHQRAHEPLMPNAVIHIVPRIEGAKTGGAFQFIAGAAILAVGWWNPAGWSFGASMMLAGGAMMLGGVAQMLTPMPKQPNMSRSEEEKGNTYFSNLENAVAQGMAVPVAFGEIMCGSRVISQSVEIMDDGDTKDVDVGKHGGSGET